MNRRMTTIGVDGIHDHKVTVVGTAPVGGEGTGNSSFAAEKESSYH